VIEFQVLDKALTGTGQRMYSLTGLVSLPGVCTGRGGGGRRRVGLDG
jgi:hypothetical protein